MRPLSRSQDLYPIAPTNYAYGNAGRNLLHGPGSETVNFSVFKNFPIKERLKFQFRFETFALFNRPIFANPGGSLPGPGANTGTTFGTASFTFIFRLHQFFHIGNKRVHVLLSQVPGAHEPATTLADEIIKHPPAFPQALANRRIKLRKDRVRLRRKKDV